MGKHCRVPGCGRFISEEKDQCDGHSDAVPDHDLTVEIDALRLILHRLTEGNDLEMQAKYIPRISSVSIQAARARHQIGGRNGADYLALLGSIIEEVERSAADSP